MVERREAGPVVYAVDDTASIAARLRELEAERAGARSGAEVGEFTPAKPAARPVPRVPEKLDPLDPLNPLWWPLSPGVQIEGDNERQAQRARLLRSLAEKPVQSVVFEHDAGRPPMRGGQSLGHFMGRATFTGLASDGDE